MIIKSSDKKVTDKVYDVCIIGSGPAGLTIAKELTDSGKTICVLECGSLAKDLKANELRTVVNSGEIKIKDSSRERVLGGTSTTWGGLSSPLDKVDMKNWPISYDELFKYYKSLHKYGFAKIEEFNEKGLDEIKKDADFEIGSEVLNEKIFIAKDPPWNFGKELKHIFEKENVELFLDSTVIKINKKESHIESVSIKNSLGLENKIKAKNFVIAAGGIESTRLLLVSNIGNENDQVGRYITNHPKNSSGFIKLNKPATNLTYLYGYLHNGWSKSAGVRVSEDVQKSLGILNSYVRLEPIFPWTDSSGVAHLLIIIKKAKLFLDWWKKQQKKLVNLRDWGETGDDVKQSKKFNLFLSIFEITKDFPAVFSYSIHRLFQNKKIHINTIRLRNFMDMEARPENRIILSDKTDRNGMRLPEVILNTSELDRKSVIELHNVIADDLKKRNIGTLTSDLSTASPWPINSEASHHLGGTIMGDDEKNSVVDKDLKLHHTDNLYICSSSVFPSAGNANPTYTICALAVRLAENLKK